MGSKQSVAEAWEKHFSYVTGPSAPHVRQCLDSSIKHVEAQGITGLFHAQEAIDPGILYELAQLEDRHNDSDQQQAPQLVREAAWLAAGGHGFAALAGVPELQQLLQHTCVAVLLRYTCRLDEHSVCSADPDDAAAKEYRELHRQCIDRLQQSLLSSLCPQLRVCLLADVAAGLMVPGHPLPPDTPEHAAALLAFIDEAKDMMRKEIQQQGEEVVYGPGRSGRLQSAINRLHAASELQSAESELAPYADLLMQLPPHLLLEMFIMLSGDSEVEQESINQFKGQYSLNNVQLGGLTFLLQADESLNWMRQIQQELDNSSSSADIGSASGSAGSSRDISRSADSNDHSRQQNGRYAGHVPSRNSGGASILAQLFADRAKMNYTSIMQCLDQLPAANDAASFANSLLQHIVAATSVRRSAGCDGSEAADSVASLAEHLRLLGGALVLQFLCAARAAGGTAWRQEVPLQTVVLFATLEQLHSVVRAGVTQLQLQEASGQLSSSTGSSRGRSNDSAHHSADTAASGAPSSPTAVGTASACHRKPSEQQQPLQFSLGCADNTSSEEAGAAHSKAAAEGQQQQQPVQQCAVHQVSLQKLLSLVQLVRDFRTANEALNAVAQQDPTTGLPQPLQQHSNRGRGTAPHRLFSAGSPLCAGFLEPTGGGIWRTSPPAAAYAGSASSASSNGSSCTHTTASWDAHSQPAADSSSGNSSNGGGGIGDAPNETLPSDEAFHRTYNWHERTALAALAGAGVLAQQLHSIWDSVLGCLKGDATQQHSLHTSAVRALQSLTMSLAEPQLAEESGVASSVGSTERHQRVQQLLQQHGLQSLSSQQVERLLYIPVSVLEQVLKLWQDALSAAGLSGSSSLLHGVLPGFLGSWRERTPQLEAIVAGRQALRDLHRHQRAKVCTPLQVWQQEQAAQQNRVRAELQQHSLVLASLQAEDSSVDERLAAVGCNSSCPVCTHDVLELHQRDTQSCSHISSSQGQHDYADAYMWRRLVWALMGRVKPRARHHFIQQLQMCPHSMNLDTWLDLINSLKMHLWYSADSFGATRSMLHYDYFDHKLEKPLGRCFMLKHYARAANLGFTKSYSSPAASLLSQQVLLSLSALHQQLLPPPETACLCPSSFGPAVGKLLMQQLGMGSTLQDFQHEVGQPQMWHVWWHIGIRRYHWLKQQQPQHAQCGVSTGPHQQQEADHLAEAAACAGVTTAAECDDEGGSSWAAPVLGLRLSPTELEELYQDPAARYERSTEFGPWIRQWDFHCIVLKLVSKSKGSALGSCGFWDQGSRILYAQWPYCAAGFASRQMCRAGPHLWSPGSNGSACIPRRQLDSIQDLGKAVTQLCRQARIQELAGDDPQRVLQSVGASYALSEEQHDLLLASGVIAELMLHGGSSSSNHNNMLSASSWVRNKALQTQLAVTRSTISESEGDVCRLLWLLNRGRDEHDLARMARLPPAPADLWWHPARWCKERTALMNEHYCSQCEAAVAMGAEQFLKEKAWKAGCSCVCSKCHVFFFCCQGCAMKSLPWHTYWCPVMQHARERWESPTSPAAPRTTGLHASQHKHISSSSSSRCARPSGGYQWPVLQLLLNAGSSSVLHEAGPLGLNCAGLLQAHAEVLVQSRDYVMEATRRSDALRKADHEAAQEQLAKTLLATVTRQLDRRQWDEAKIWRQQSYRTDGPGKTLIIL